MIFWYANWLREGSFSTRMTQANTGMTTIPLEERNWEEWQQIQLYKAQLCCGASSQSKKLCFQWKERKASKRLGNTEVVGAVLAGGCGAEQRPQHEFILV